MALKKLEVVYKRYTHSEGNELPIIWAPNSTIRLNIFDELEVCFLEICFIINAGRKSHKSIKKKWRWKQIFSANAWSRRPRKKLGPAETLHLPIAQACL